MTVLHLAAFKGFEQIVKILVEHGANVDLQDTVLILIFISFVFSDFICWVWVHYWLFHVDSEWLGCVIFILFFFFLTTFFLLKYGMTALHRAAGLGFEQIVKILVEHGSNLDLQTSVLIFIFIIFLFFSHFFVVLCCVIFILFCSFFLQLSFC